VVLDYKSPSKATDTAVENQSRKELCNRAVLNLQVGALNTSAIETMEGGHAGAENSLSFFKQSLKKKQKKLQPATTRTAT
jgi:hypothetical protein